MKDLSYTETHATIEQLREGGFLSAERLKSMGYRQSNPRVLWLRRLGAPSFQFRDGKLVDIVAKINQKLSLMGYDDRQIAYWWTNPDSNAIAPIDLIDKPTELWKLAQKTQK